MGGIVSGMLTCKALLSARTLGPVLWMTWAGGGGRCTYIYTFYTALR